VLNKVLGFTCLENSSNSALKFMLCLPTKNVLPVDSQFNGMYGLATETPALLVRFKALIVAVDFAA